ncbi:Mobile element protein [Microcystis panniformis FACHB-1757]|uniref:Mobile element protein n=1 Tax=Microcystis panniformis FACHB-1757 TaxID=1638788 RepID=A0A0K1S3W9_9CHRO|nr:Mobile element protein [Microcystis panniformis FACHB-1757]
MDGSYKGWNPYIERHLAIFVNCFFLERTNQLSLLPDKDLVDLCPPIEPYQVTKNHKESPITTYFSEKIGSTNSYTSELFRV